MKTFTLVGIDQLGAKARIGKDVISFTDLESKFSIVILSDCAIQLTTNKGCYNLVKHPTLNYYFGECLGHKVQVHLKAISGWIKYW